MIGITERGDGALDYDEAIYKAHKLDVKGIIFITKHPMMLEHKLATKPPNVPFIVHCTITGFGGEPIEPNVPKAELALKGYHGLVDAYGKNNVILRVDPLLLYDKAMPILREAEGRVRISFVDGYPHVRERFNNRCKEYLPLLPSSFHFPLAARQEVAQKVHTLLGYPPEICGEPDMSCTGCVSDLDLQALGIGKTTSNTSHQRNACRCLAQKTELLSRRHPCPHNCAYCYWKD